MESTNNTSDSEMEQLPLVQEFAEYSTIHGVRYVLSTAVNNGRRILWLFILIMMSSIFLWQFIDSIRTYQDRETYTSTNKYEMYNLTLPSITICNVNTYRSSFIDNIHPNFKIILTNFMEIALGFRDRNTGLDLDENVTAIMKQFNFRTFFKMAGHTVEEMFKVCSFAHNHIPCSEFLTPIVTNIGQCYTVGSKILNTSSGPKKQDLTMDLPGPFDGINLVINTQTEEYLLTTGMGEGLVINIHPPDEFPFINTQSIFIPTGHETYIRLQKSIRKILSKPYSTRECIKPSDKLNEKYRSELEEYPYSEQTCYGNCFIKTIYGCDCDPFNEETENGCSLLEGLTCGGQRFNGAQRLRTCYEKCLPECEHTKYEYKISHTSFPNTFVLNSVTKSYNLSASSYNDIKRNYVSLHIFFDDTTYISVEEKPVTNIFLLLSNFGGILGLYLGASFMSLFEFIDVIYCYVVQKVRKKDTPTMHLGNRSIFHVRLSKIVEENNAVRSSIYQH